MKLLNLCCGAVRPQGEEWWNMDSLYDVLPVGTPERTQLDSEPRYIDRDATSLLPFDDDSLDGIIFSHALEHFDCQVGVAIMRDCYRALKPGGELLVSVPDASYFLHVYHRDTVENAVELFGEPIHLPDGETTFFGYGLWNRYHRAILTYDSLRAYFVRAGFWNTGRLDSKSLATVSDEERVLFEGEILSKMTPLLNRLPFSLVMCANK